MKKKIPRSDWVFMPHPAHFICSRDCKFFLATRVGNVIVSTIGEYLPDAPVRKIIAEYRGIKIEGKGDARLADYMKRVGYEDLHIGGWKYETMVFPCEKRVSKGETCCEYKCSSWTPLDEEWYKKGEDAKSGHYKLCEKWAQNNEVPEQ